MSVIGTHRVEEARALDSYAGYHQFENEAGVPFGSFEVFWDEPEKCSDPDNCWCAREDVPKPGWYWWACFPGCLPDSEAIGPFGSSAQAHTDAMENM